jgi:hypothetical protein
VSFTPSKLSAPPDFPVVHVVPFCSAPWLPLPEPSAAVVPKPSSSARLTIGPPEAPPEEDDEDDVTVRAKVAVRTTDPAVPVTVIVEVVGGVDDAV